MGHHHSNKNQSGKNLKIAFLLNLGFAIIEIVGGFYVNSVAIISDAVHDLGDSISLGLAWYLNKKSAKASNSTFSFGYKRFSLLGALINSIILISGSLFVITKAIGRIIHPEVSDADGMIVFAIFGILVNGYAAWKVSGGKTLNERIISWHLVEDVLGWVAVLLVAIVLQFYDNNYLDPALSLLIAMYILYNVFKTLKETLTIFLQGTPPEIEFSKLKEEFLTVDKVESLHHSHVWSLDGEQHVFTTHVKLQNIENLKELLVIKKQIREILKPYNFKHHTVEVELHKENCRIESK